MKVFTSASAIALGFSFFQLALAVPLTLNETYRSLFESDEPHPSLLRRAEDFYLRIMPLGASITAGEPFEHQDDPALLNKNGYRAFLRSSLRVMGWKVNMVGSRNFGDMADNSHEGVPGETINAVAFRGISSAHDYKPNIILINAGTNDARINSKEEPSESQHVRMEEMILSLFEAVDIDPQTGEDKNNVVIVLSTLLPCAENICGGRIPQVNNEYRKIVTKLSNPPYNKKIVLADMDDGFIQLPDSNNNPWHIWDGIHPTTEGSKRMAAVWIHAINRAIENGWIKEPLYSKIGDDGVNFTCEKSYGSGNNNGRAGWQVLAAGNPLIRDDGRYRHSSVRHANLFTGTSVHKLAHSFHFANLFKIDVNSDRMAALDELVIIERQLIWSEGKEKTLFSWWKNTGGKLDHQGNLPGGAEFPQECEIGGIHFGDVDGDGYDDLLCVDEDGTVNYYRHNGENDFRFEPRRTFRERRPGYKRDNVRFGDIDGDGRLDYCCIGYDGNIDCFRNGYLPNGQRWQYLGTVFTAKGMGDIRGVRFVDVNGDGRSDWVWLAENGRSVIYINQRGEDKSLRPLWVEAEVSHGGGFENLFDPGSRSRIQFGRVYGSGRYDYMVVEQGDCSGKCSIAIHAYENKGTGGKFQKGDGAYWGDMRGRGVDDYIWISPDGVVNLFPNRNSPENTAEFGDVHKGIWGGVFAPIHTGKDRRSLHIADWDGDGKDDIISVEKRTGKLTIWLSAWDGHKYTPRIIHKNDREYCKEGWGIGYFDNGHHFADISGDGRADYICMEKNGRATAWINDKNRHPGQDLVEVGQVKFSEGLDRENFRFADVNGDKKADLIWLDKFGGDARVWQNIDYLKGDETAGGSKFLWRHIGPRYLLSARGANIHFPNLGGQGRADMVEVRPSTAFGFAWFNMCPTGGIDDDDSLKDPGLPTYIPNPQNPGEDPVPDIGDAEFCDGTVQDWNEELWNKMGMRDWLQLRFQFYSKSEEWPLASDPSGIPSIISEYSLNTRDKKWRWNDDCKGIDLKCEIPDSDLSSDECIGHSRRAFMIWAARNYARFLHSSYNSLTLSSLQGSLKFGSFVEDFRDDRSDEKADSISASGWLTIANGIISTIGAFIPAGPGQIGVTALAGVAGIGGSIFGMFASDTQKYDPKLQAWRDLNTNFEQALRTAQSVMYDHFSRTLAQRPPAGDTAISDALLRILGSGGFADSSTNAMQSFHPETQGKMIMASTISAIWNQQNVFIFRFKEVKLSDTFIYDKCRHPKNAGEHGFDEATFCIDGVNYIILRWSNDYEVSVRSEFGQTAEILKKYTLTHKEIFEGSWNIQERMRLFGPNQNNYFSRFAQKLVDDNVSPHSQDLIQWTLPVCNWEYTKMSIPSDCGKNRMDCLFKQIHINCADVYYDKGVTGSGWPYRNQL